MLNLCTAAQRARERGDEVSYNAAVTAARQLVDAVHLCLGSPSGKAIMQPVGHAGVSLILPSIFTMVPDRLS